MTSGADAELGAHVVDGGVRFAVYAPEAERVDLCLFDEADREKRAITLPDCNDGVWHTVVPGCASGQRYGYRAYGTWAPEQGLRFDPSKVLVDPYARQLSGDLYWSNSLFSTADSASGDPHDRRHDSARCVPKGVVTAPLRVQRPRPDVPWRDTVLYETNLRGFTMRHPDVPLAHRGKYLGMTNGAVLEYLKALGITSIELLPVHFFVDEMFLTEKGLKNYWGYNTLSFFAPMNRYASESPLAELVEMIDTIHDAGLEVILDVVYNHTAEGNEKGPTLSFRGLHNRGYYRLLPDRPEYYINDTGCGNTVDINDPGAQRLVLDSLRYFAGDLGVDGFRFDLAPVLGRHPNGFSREHPFFKAIAADPVLSQRKMIAEPWDVGPGGYQLGQFPVPWAHWNDQFRDTVRCFWRGDQHITAQFARRMHGSADLFEPGGSGPLASVNFVTAHDGFTLSDVVSYEVKRNEANGEDNRDGHNHNFSRNYGAEGPTREPGILALRQRQRLNMLASLMFAQGTPMLLAGDEIGHTQGGNNNAYAQDNDTSWIDWDGQTRDADFLSAVRQLIAVRADLDVLRGDAFLHGRSFTADNHPNIAWFNPDGSALADREWFHARAFALVLRATQTPRSDVWGVAMLFNASERAVTFRLPPMDRGGVWAERFHSDIHAEAQSSQRTADLSAPACALWAYGASPTPTAR